MARLELKAGEVHIWRAGLDYPIHVRKWLEGALSAEDRERAARFRFPEDRRRFAAARGLLRVILAGYLDRAPGGLRFDPNRHGKPRLADPSPSDVRFNLSHSGELALYAVALGREVGIDVEQVRPDRMDAATAERVFSPREFDLWRRLPGRRRTAAFFACWTRKEAYVKARGEGMTFPSRSFEVSLTPGEPAALLWVDGEPDAPQRWSMVDLAPGRGYAGALAAEGRDLRVSAFSADPVIDPE